ncbi:MAG: N-6 DNA methylase [Thermoproteota archaeon]
MARCSKTWTDVEREIRRQKGQFWTPEWVAEAMVAWVLAGGAKELFDPAVGPGVFLLAAKRLCEKNKVEVRLYGTEIDRDIVLNSPLRSFADIEIRDFVLDPPSRRFQAIVANPPYVRHHRLSADTKIKLRARAHQIIGKPLDMRIGLHTYFLVQALDLLDEGGRLAFIVSADVCEGVASRSLWEWVAKRYRIDAVVTFCPEASPFPELDVNPVIVCISRRAPSSSVHWALCKKGGTPDLFRWMESEFSFVGPDLEVYVRDLSEAVMTGLSRRPRAPIFNEKLFCLSHFASVMRGIATGANSFFLLTKRDIERLGLPENFFHRAIARTRDVPNNILTRDFLDALDARGRPTYLLYVDKPFDKLPESMQEYLKIGERLGLPKRPLIKTRKPWYRVERREVPMILFAYLGRRNCRFILNEAKALPLTGFLCVYPHEGVEATALWQALNAPEVLSNLGYVAKSYGGGAIKVEPRALEQLPIPESIVKAFSLSVPPPEKDDILLRW